MLQNYAFQLRYLQFLHSSGVSDPGNYCAPMVAAYTEAQRFYHDKTHITFMLDKLDSDIAAGNIVLSQWEESCVRWAIYWHDYVYDPQAKDNESQSIQAWESFVASVSPQLDIYKAPVSALIHSTISHSVPPLPSPDQQNPEGSELPLLVISYFLDLDLSILAAPTDVYRTYANNIRKEYSQYSIDDYRKGRLAIMRAFLGREKIFLTSSIEGREASMEMMEARARGNVGWEVGELEAARLPAQ